MKSFKKFLYTANSPSIIYSKFGVTGNPPQTLKYLKSCIPNCVYTVFYHDDAEQVEKTAKIRFNEWKISGNYFRIGVKAVYDSFVAAGGRILNEEEWTNYE